MAKKFKAGCKYQVKPEFYDLFYFDIFWDGKPRDYVFTALSVSRAGSALGRGGLVFASARERKYCKRIK
jgi:hypothetical protein